MDPLNGSRLVDRARAFALGAHALDERKQDGVEGAKAVPYFEGHLEPVATMVRSAGGSDVQVAAAYLHDVAEDHGGRAMLDRVEAEFGPEVARIVADLSDSLIDTSDGAEKPPWPERKQAYLAALGTKATASLEVSVADKAHNARCLLDDYLAVGDALWARFNESRPEAQLWYYTTLRDVLAERLPGHPLAVELVATVDELERRVRADHPNLPQSGPWRPPA